jgi:uncharacterized protein YbjT (DUF2867 family)
VPENSLDVLVVGATTGSVGRLVVEEAVRRGHDTRALVRDPPGRVHCRPRPGSWVT